MSSFNGARARPVEQAAGVATQDVDGRAQGHRSAAHSPGRRRRGESHADSHGRMYPKLRENLDGEPRGRASTRARGLGLRRSRKPERCCSNGQL